MSRSQVNYRTGLVVILLSIAIAGCATSGTYLQWKQVDAGALMKSATGQQTFNTIRFATYGPKSEQLYGYFLYRDGIEVLSEQGIPFEKLGKMTLQQVMGNYGSVERSNMYSAGSALNVQEYTRKGEVVGFTAADINLDVSIWDLTKEDGLPVLRIVYRDQRERREIDRMHPMRR